jgi:predicted DNA-binding transcriptional regulator AlpA
MTRKLVRLPRALEITGLKRTALYDKVAAGILPKPIKIDPNGRAVAWIEDELLAVHKCPRGITQTRMIPNASEN